MPCGVIGCPLRAHVQDIFAVAMKLAQITHSAYGA
jgi:hypothetical protein